MSLIGKEISDSTVQAYAGGEFREAKKSDILRKWAIFFFYSIDLTFVCPMELEDLADKYEDFKSVDCEIYSVSYDSHFVRKTWHDVPKITRRIKYPMPADPAGGLVRDPDAMIEADGMAKERSSIVNLEGKIVTYEVIAGNVGRSADELFGRVQASRFVVEHGDQVYPTKWQPGADTLKPSLDLMGPIQTHYGPSI